MLKQTSSTESTPFLWHAPALLLWLLLPLSLSAAPITVHLKNGDRIAGELISQTDDHLVIKTPWAAAITIPKEHIAQSQSPSAEPTISAAPPAANPPVAPQTGSPTTTAAAQPAAKPPAKPKATDEWKFETRLGADMIRGERDRDIYYGQMALTFARPYESNPKKFFRNKLDFRADYSETDDKKSANRMSGSDKTDFDFGKHAYAYNYVGGGYDEIRRINLQYEVGPGVGYHLFRRPNFVANVEGGLTYQYQDREVDDELESLYSRVAQDITWKIFPKITFTQRSALLTSMEDTGEMQLRFEANLAFGLVQHLSLNLTAIELYDTRPVTGVSKNEFQLRSALGITF